MRWKRLLLLLIVTWGAGTLLVAGRLGGAESTGALVVPLLEEAGLSTLWAHRAHKALRKAGHVGAYAGFAAAVWWVLPPGRRRVGWALLATGILATADEAAQAFTPGRGASPFDVLLDVGAGALAVGLIERRVQRRALLDGTAEPARSTGP